MKVYISTPVTSRPEKTLFEQRRAAEARCLELGKKWAEQISPENDLTSFCDCTAPVMNNAWAMGRCIENLLTCDAIFMDEGYEKSKGCKAELEVARIYGLQIYGICDNEIFKLTQRNDENKLTEFEQAVENVCLSMQGGGRIGNIHTLAEKLIDIARKEIEKEPKSAEWSEEDLQHKSWILECLADGEKKMPEYAEDFRAAYKWLKCLHSSCKPSEEQIKVFLKANPVNLMPEELPVYKSLCNDIQKLM